MSALSGIKNAARAAFRRVAEARTRRETARLLEALPQYILKDIGYGGHDSDVSNYR